MGLCASLCWIRITAKDLRLGKPTMYFPLNKVEDDIPIPKFIKSVIGLDSSRPNKTAMGVCVRACVRACVHA